jgi:hypothetical protein
LRRKFNLAVSQNNFNALRHIFLEHQHSLSTSYSNLESTELGESEFLLSDIHNEFSGHVAHSICEIESISLDVRHVQLNFIWSQLTNLLTGREALPLTSESFKNILFLVEFSHKLDYLLLSDRGIEVVFTEEPAGMVLQLRVRIPQELKLDVAQSKSTRYKLMNVTK